MAAPRITFHQITIITLCFGIACSIASCATRAWKSGGLFDLPNEAWANTIKAFAIIGVAMLGFSLFMEILMVASNTFKLSRAMHLLCFICCLLSVGSKAMIKVGGLPSKGRGTHPAAPPDRAVGQKNPQSWPDTRRGTACDRTTPRPSSRSARSNTLGIRGVCLEHSRGRVPLGRLAKQPASLLISLGLYSRHYSYGGYSVWLLTAGTVFALEAFFFYTIQWRCT
uniref:Uncharacterized protein n=1 Tax=Macrostomum lignano TaxID=282301 RepID=A0A1I8FTX5_9PLAT